MYKIRKLSVITVLLFMSFPVFAQSLLCTNGQEITGLSTGDTSNSGIVAPVGTEWSEVQNETGNTTESNTLSGSSCSVTATVFRCADDFIVPAGGWDINAVTTYAYQTGFTGTESPITEMTVQFFGPCDEGLIPGDVGCDLVAGDDTTNVLATSTDISLFRIFNSSVPAPGATPGTTRKVWVNEAAFSPSVVLNTPGRYWMDFNTNINNTSGHFVPLLTIPGLRGLPGWNAVQRGNSGFYEPVIDVGNPGSAPDVPLDFPFELFGTGLSTPIGQSCKPPDIIFANGFEITAP